MMIPSDDPRLTPIRLRKELLNSGWDDAQILRAVRRGDLARIRRGAYVSAPVHAELDAVVRHALRARAAARQSKTAVVVSHQSAISMIPDVAMWGLGLGDVHLTRRDGRTGRKEAGVQQHRGRIIDGDVIRLGDIDVMAPHRALLEVTTTATVECGLAVVNDVLHKKLVTLDQLTDRYRTMDHWPETLATDMVLRLANPAIESVGESRTLYMCFRQGLPLPEVQVEIRDASGNLVARLDFAWPEHKVWLEFDGKVKYLKFLRPGESPSDAVVREKRRQEAVEDITGWRCIRITWDDLRYPELLAAKIRAAFAQKAA